MQSRPLVCYCHKCRVLGAFDQCDNLEMCQQPQREELVPENNSTAAREVACADSAVAEDRFDHGVGIARLAVPVSTKFCNIALLCEESDDDYWIMKITQGVHKVRYAQGRDAEFEEGSVVLCGRYYEKVKDHYSPNLRVYRLTSEVKRVYAHLVFFVGFKLDKCRIDKEWHHYINLPTHEEIMGALDRTAAVV